MPRPREFDIDTALERAMQVFWAKGYESTSLDDLCEATGVGRSSLYSAFNDKRDLYLRALDHYENASAARIAAALARFLTAGIQGLRLVGKANPDRSALRDVAAVMLRCLES